MKVAILCGGNGTRLGELTRDKPKSLVEVAGRPFIEWQLELLKRAGYREIVLCVGHQGDQIANYVGGWVVYSWDFGMGTGGAIRQALPDLDNEFMVLYGDSYLDCPYGFVEKAFTMGTLPAMITLYNSMPYGIGCFRPEAFEGFTGAFDLNEVYERMALENRLATFHMTERWYEIGTPRGLEETCRHLSKTTSRDYPPF
jgi:N-acetyl-alpha-D-muramate 1-phosphate uridylyltransferase